MSVIYKYNNYGDLVNFNACFNELGSESNLYVNESDSYYNVFNNMKYLKKISYNDIKKYQDKIIIFHSK